jgi:AcrR family transcriptional regulator
MAKAQRREDALTRGQIVEAAIALLDTNGEDGLTFRALSERLATGPGAIYWHIADKSDLLSAACDAVIARAMNAVINNGTPKKMIRAVALAVFDAIDMHPWAGSALARTAGHMPIVRVLERIGQQVRAMGVKEDQQWEAVSALMAYILGVSGQNAANGQLARTRGLHRDDFLEKLAGAWLQLDPRQYPFTRSIAGRMRAHDDREDFLSVIDVILRGIDSLRPKGETIRW